IAYRNPHAESAPASADVATAPANDKHKRKEKPEAVPGYFEATAQLSAPAAPATATPQASRTVVVLMDTSLSMQWDKLERSYAAAAKVLESLRPQDRFNLLLFNTRVDSFRPQP